MEAGARILRGVASAVRRRTEAIAGAEVLERDGLMLALSNLDDPSLNGAYVRHPPVEPRAAVRWASAEVAARGHRLGIDLPPARVPAFADAVRAAGLDRLLTRDAMARPVAGLDPSALPDGISVEPVESREQALTLARVDAEAWGEDLEHSVRALAAGVVGVEGVRAFVASTGGAPVGCAVAYEHEGAVGVFGVGVVPRARGRGLGSALTLEAARAFPADLVWLFPTEMAASLYRRLGFEPVEAWEVWVERRRRGGRT